MCSKTTLCDLFDEDIVVHLNRKNNDHLEFGLVIESSENATSDEDEDQSDSDSDRNTKWRKIKQGFAKIAWYPNGDTQVLSEDKVVLYDRSLLAGDVVQRIDSATNRIVENGEHGYCKSAKIFATIKILGTDKVIENIDCEHIEMLSRISTDTVCVLDSWIGYVKDVNNSITLKCSDGSIVIANDEQLDDFCDLLTQRDNDNSEFNRSDFYIGQQLYGPKRHLKNCKWIVKNDRTKAFLCSDSPKHSKIKLAVEDVSIESVSINWICCISDENGVKKKFFNSDSDQSVNDSTNLSKIISNKLGANGSSGLHAPNQLVIGEAIQRIKCLNYFAHSSLQIGHQCYYTIRQSDNIINFSQWNSKQTNKFSPLKKISIQNNRSLINDINDIIDSNNYKSSCDTLNNLPNCSLESESTETESVTSLKCDNIKTKKKRKNKGNGGRFSISLDKIKKKKLRASQRKRVCNLPLDIKPGLRFPVEIIATHTTVTVIWQNGANEEHISSTNLYPVHHIDDHDFFPGDYVVENKDFVEPFSYGVIQNSDFISRVASVKWFNASQGPNNSPVLVSQTDVSVYDIKDHPDFNFRPACCVVRIPNNEEDGNDLLSRAGQIVDITQDGLLRCVWTNGQTSLVYPFHLFVIGDYDSDDLWDDSDDELGYDYSSDSCSSTASWETESEQTTDDNQHSSKNRKQTSKNKSALKVSSHSNSHTLSYELLNVLYNGATQIEEWLRNGTGNYLKNFNLFQNAIKSFKADLIESDSQTNDDALQTEKISHSNSKIHKLSKRIIQLLPFTKALINGANQSNQSDSMEVSESSDTKDPNQSILNGLSDESKPSTSNVKAFLELLENFKSELINNEVTKNPTKKTDPELGCNSMDLDSDKCDINSSLEVQNEETQNNTTEENTGKIFYFDSVPECHRFYSSSHQPKNLKEFVKRVKQEITVLQTSLPDGIFVAIFHDRMDLYSILITGPKCTPYEDGLFVFDVQFPSGYPNVPPLVHYHSYCSDRLNPNLYESGKVCISLLGTWSGKGTEVWSSTTSNLLQVIISIQGLILVPEPYYNEAGYLKQRGTTLANENSRLYNEMVVLKLVQSMTKLLLSPYPVFEHQIRQHIIAIGEHFIKRHENWVSLSEISVSKSSNENIKLTELKDDLILPQFPLLPASLGFCLTLNKALALFKDALQSIKS